MAIRPLLPGIKRTDSHDQCVHWSRNDVEEWYINKICKNLLSEFLNSLKNFYYKQGGNQNVFRT